MPSCFHRRAAGIGIVVDKVITLQHLAAQIGMRTSYTAVNHGDDHLRGSYRIVPCSGGFNLGQRPLVATREIGIIGSADGRGYMVGLCVFHVFVALKCRQ